MYLLAIDRKVEWWKRHPPQERKMFFQIVNCVCVRHCSLTSWRYSGWDYRSGKKYLSVSSYSHYFLHSDKKELLKKVQPNMRLIWRELVYSQDIALPPLASHVARQHSLHRRTCVTQPLFILPLVTDRPLGIVSVCSKSLCLTAVSCLLACSRVTSSWSWSTNMYTKSTGSKRMIEVN